MVRSINHAIFRHEGDMAQIRTFFEDFGLVLSHENEKRLYFRGTEGRPFIYIAERGPKGFGGTGYEVESEEALKRYAAHFGAPIEDMGTPWGGKLVASKDPRWEPH